MVIKQIKRKAENLKHMNELNLSPTSKKEYKSVKHNSLLKLK